MSVRVFVEEISIWISRLRKGDPPSPIQVGIIQSSEGLNRTEKLEKGKSSKKGKAGRDIHLLLRSDFGALASQAFRLRLGLTSSAPDSRAFGLGLTSSAPMVLRPLFSDWITPLAFLVLQLTDGRLWDFMPSISPWVNSYNLLLSIYLSIHPSINPICFVSLKSPNTDTILTALYLAFFTYYIFSYRLFNDSVQFKLTWFNLINLSFIDGHLCCF